MAVTVDQIKSEFPEFAHTSAALIAAKIADASGMMDAATFGDDYDQAVKYQACHLITTSPSGEFARLKPKEEGGSTSTYQQRLRELVRSKVAGPMVV